MNGGIDAVALGIFIAIFVVVTVMGFMAARWRRAADLMNLDEWGLGGRSFGTFVTWFLLGGDLYTAYTFIAVPALLYGAGSLGFFAMPYAIIAYPLVFVFLPRLWSVSHRRGYVTPADFARGRFGSRGLALAVALTGIVALMPYIALQLVGIQVVLEVMGIGGGAGTSWWVKDLPLFVAFALLAAYTYTSGLRAPAMIAFVKDTLIYLVIIVAVIYIPYRLGGWDTIFGAAGDKLTPEGTSIAAGPLADPGSGWAFATLALGSAMALFMYPHSITGVLASRGRNVIRRNAAILPAYSFLLGLIALLGFMAIAAGIEVDNAQLAVPVMFEQLFPGWFAGLAFAAIGVGALVPAAIMSIAAANLFTRNIYRDYLRPDATPREEARVSQLVSLVVKIGAVIFIVGLDNSFAINLQLLGGIWILQTFPTIGFGLFTRWFHRWGLLAGWLAGMAYGTIAAYNVPVDGQPGTHFGGSVAEVPFLGIDAYIALTAFVLNVAVAVLATWLLRATGVPDGGDETAAGDYTADADEPRVRPEAAQPVS